MKMNSEKKALLPNYPATMTLSQKLIYYAPRILSIGFVAFISIFALDVFAEHSGFEVILPLIMHLLPSIILLIVALVAWKYELVGAIIFLGFALLYVMDVGFTRPLSWYLAIIFPALLVGILYLISWIQKRNRINHE